MDKHLIVSIAMDEVDNCDPFKTAVCAVDLTLDAVVVLLKRKSAEHTARGNKISALVIDDILKEFY